MPKMRIDVTLKKKNLEWIEQKAKQTGISKSKIIDACIEKVIPNYSGRKNDG